MPAQRNTVKVDVLADTSNFSKGMRKLNNTKLSKFGKTMKKAGKVFAGVTAGSSAAFAGVAAGLAGAAAGILGIALKLSAALAQAGEKGKKAVVKQAGQAVKSAQKIAQGFLTALQTLPTLVQKFLPKILKMITGLMPKIAKGLADAAPSLGAAAVKMVGALTTAFTQSVPSIITAVTTLIPKIVVALVNNLPQLIQGGVQLLMGIVQAIPKVLPSLLSGLTKAIGQVVKSLVTMLPVLIQGGVRLFVGLVSALGKVMPKLITALIKAIPKITKTLVGALPQMIKAAVQLMMALVKALPIILPELIKAAIDVIVQVAKLLPTLIPQLVKAAVKLMKALVTALIQVGRTLWPQLRAFLSKMADRIAGYASVLLRKARALFGSLLDAARGKAGDLLAYMKGLPGKIVDKLGSLASLLTKPGKDLVAGLTSGISQAMQGIKTWLRDHVWDPIVSGVKSLFGIHSPSTVFEGFGLNMVRGLVNGLIKGNPGAFVKKVFGGVSDNAGQALGWLVNKGKVAWSALGDLGSSLWSKVSGWFGGGSGAGVGGGVSRWTGTLKRALAMNGVPVTPAYVNAWLRQIATESGGNPFAVQHGYTDINSITGDLAKGILQTISATFNAYAWPGHRNIFNAFDNMLAAIRYALSRYGLAGMLGVIGHGHGYAGGTRAAMPGWHLVGENGPEMVKLTGGEQVKPQVVDSASPVQHILNVENLGYDPREIFTVWDRKERAARLRNNVVGVYS